MTELLILKVTHYTGYSIVYILYITDKLIVNIAILSGRERFTYKADIFITERFLIVITVLYCEL